MWTLVSMNPGVANLPAASMTRAPRGTVIDARGPISAMRLPRTTIVTSGTGAPPLPSINVAPTSATTASVRGRSSRTGRCPDRVPGRTAVLSARIALMRRPTEQTVYGRAITVFLLRGGMLYYMRQTRDSHERRRGGRVERTSNHSRRGAAVLLLMLPLMACDVGSQAGSEPAARDSAGVRIVENERGAWGEQPAWRIDPQPLLTIGQVEGAPEYQLYRVRGAIRRADGSIVVADLGSH